MAATGSEHESGEQQPQKALQPQEVSAGKQSGEDGEKRLSLNVCFLEWTPSETSTETRAPVTERRIYMKVSLADSIFTSSAVPFWGSQAVKWQAEHSQLDLTVGGLSADPNGALVLEIREQSEDGVDDLLGSAQVLLETADSSGATVLGVPLKRDDVQAGTLVLRVRVGK
jgi:hypothetical protein